MSVPYDADEEYEAIKRFHAAKKQQRPTATVEGKTFVVTDRCDWRSKTTTQYVTRWVRHAAVNLGQCAHDIRHIVSPPPDAVGTDGAKAPTDVRPGTLGWCLWGLVDRLPDIAMNLWFAAIPPELHDGHNCADLDEKTALEWFLAGYKSPVQLH